MKSFSPVMTLALLAAFFGSRADADAAPPHSYTPTPIFCASGQNALCDRIPAFIGDDPALGTAPKQGYAGIVFPPTSAAKDVQSPFDNMAWQMFVALNWPAGPSEQAVSGPTSTGRRVWQDWRRVQDVFGAAPNTPSCANPENLPVLAIASNGAHTPSARGEEYLQASTGLPLIDANGNWTVYERRLNDVEIRYLLAPDGDPSHRLTTTDGQKAFVAAGGKVSFPLSASTPVGRNGAMEIKAAWRIISKAQGDDPARYFTMRAMLAVSGDLVSGAREICRPVTLGLVGMHILQKNPDQGNLFSQWIWASFEHVDNAPLAKTACDPTGKTDCPNILTKTPSPSCGPADPDAKIRYSYFRSDAKDTTSVTNVAPIPSTSAPAFHWRAEEPYAGDYLPPGSLGPQAARCWSVYSYTQTLNAAWQDELKKAGSVFANYMLIGTQWGTHIAPYFGYELPSDAVPGLLSNVTMETYIQNFATEVNEQGPGSCVGCHSGATLALGSTPSDFSFLPSLAEPGLTRRIGVKSR